MIGITGANGFIGSYLKGDAIDLGDIKIPASTKVIYHLGALNKTYLSYSRPLATFEANVLSTVRLLEAARQSNVEKIIFTSSILVYKDLEKTRESDHTGFNGCPYGYEKLVCEEYIKIYCELFGIDYVILRLSGVFGPGMTKGPVNDIVRGFQSGDVKLYVNRESVYNFVFIDDVIRNLESALKWKNKTMNIFGSDVSLNVIYDYLRSNTGKSPGIQDTKEKVRIRGIKQYDILKKILRTYERMDKPLQ